MQLRRAFTLIELLVVIAIIAILAAILFPVFTQAKLSAKTSLSLSQMRQLSAAVMMYAGDNDDYFVPASARPADNVNGTPKIWTEGLQSYVKNKQIFIAPDSQGAFAEDWNGRRNQSVGYSDATGVDPFSTAVEGNAPPTTEGFTTACNFAKAEESARIGLFAFTANAPAGITNTKHRGYVFNPYNGLNSPDNDYQKGLPLISDRDLVTEAGDENYPNSPSLSAGGLKPIYARIGSTKKNEGRTPVVFADGHAKVYTAKQLNRFGEVIWRFR